MTHYLAIVVVLAAVVFSNVECDSTRYYAVQPRLFGWGWGKKPIKVSISKGGWGWKKPVIQGVGIYGGIRLHHGSGWDKFQSGLTGGWGHGVELHGGKGHGGGGQGGGGGHEGHGWGWQPKKVHHGWGWGGYEGGHGDDDGDYDDYERGLPLERSVVFRDEESSVESEEAESFDSSENDYAYAPFYEPVFI